MALAADEAAVPVPLPLDLTVLVVKLLLLVAAPELAAAVVLAVPVALAELGTELVPLAGPAVTPPVYVEDVEFPIESVKLPD